VTPSDVEAYLAALPPESRGVVAELRETIRSVVPEATETISYRMPAFKQSGRVVVWYAGFKDHASLFPASAGVRDALGEDLSAHLSGKGTIRFPLGERIPAALVQRVVRARLDELAS
jgi:uncharacterized protein YdhG (YjbR/CyaY superfamily)